MAASKHIGVCGECSAPAPTHRPGCAEKVRAAAPQMLEALREVSALLPDGIFSRPDVTKALARARAAIKAATGGEP